MATNNFGDNWLSDEERDYWGVGQPLKDEQKSERQLANEYHWKRERENLSFVILVGVVFVLPALFWTYTAIATVLKFWFGWNII